MGPLGSEINFLKFFVLDTLIVLKDIYASIHT